MTNYQKLQSWLAEAQISLDKAGREKLAEEWLDQLGPGKLIVNVLRELEALTAEVTNLRAAQESRPISEAPKDGSKITCLIDCRWQDAELVCDEDSDIYYAAGFRIVEQDWPKRYLPAPSYQETDDV